MNRHTAAGAEYRMMSVMKPKTASKTIEGKIVHKILLVGHSSSLSRRCVEDLLLMTANNEGVGLQFTESTDCDLCVVCSDGLMGYNMRSLCQIIEDVPGPVVAFGLGTEGNLEKHPDEDVGRLSKVLDRMEFLGVRNELTKTDIIRVSNNRRIEIVGDAIVNFQFIDCTEVPRHGDLGINVIELPGADGQEEKTFEAIVFCLDRVMRSPEFADACCHILCFGRHGPCKDELKGGQLRSKLAFTTRTTVHPYLRDVLLSYSRLSNLDLFISMRTNSAFIGAINGIAPVVLEHRGMRGQEIMDLIGCGDLVRSPYDLTGPALYQTVVETLEAWKKRSAKVQGKVAEWREKQREFVTKVVKRFFC